jgi:hypothetical protein
VLYKRLTLVFEAGRVAKAFYPVFRRLERRGGGRVARLVTFDEAGSAGSRARDRRPRGADDARVVRARRRRAASAARRPGCAADRPEAVLPHRRQLPRHEEESKQVDWSHKIAPWIVFFQNVDALVGQDEPVYPEHLTELDYGPSWRSAATGSGSDRRAMDCRRLRDLQRHHRARSSARDGVGVFSFCKAIDISACSARGS